MNFEEHIKDWVALDNQIKIHKDSLNSLRKERNIVMQNILFLAENKKLKNTIIQISDGKLKFQNNKITAPLTLKHIHSCLSDCIEQPSQVELIMNYIKEKREIRYVEDIKRYYNKTN